jgi:hypothetical protein
VVKKKKTGDEIHESGGGVKKKIDKVYRVQSTEREKKWASNRWETPKRTENKSMVHTVQCTWGACMQGSVYPLAGYLKLL